MKALLIFLSLLLTTPVFAAAKPPLHLPPPPFNKPYTGPLRIYNVPLWKMPFYCMGPAYACTYISGKTCIVYLPKIGRGVNQEGYAGLRKHELGHCNGWAADHP